MGKQRTPTETLSPLGKRIRQLREHLGYNTQKKFADALGVSDVSVSKWEMAAENLRPKNIAKIQELTGVSKDWLLTGMGEMLQNEGAGIDAPNRIDDINLDKPNALYGYATTSIQRVVTISENELGRPNIEMVSSRAAASYLDNLQKPEYIKKL